MTVVFYAACVCLVLFVLGSFILNAFRSRFEGHDLPRFSDQPQMYREDLDDSITEGSGWTCDVCAFGNHKDSATCKLCKVAQYKSVETPVKMEVTKKEPPVKRKASTLRQVAASRRLLWRRKTAQDGVMRWEREESDLRPSDGYVRVCISPDQIALEPASLVKTDYNYTMSAPVIENAEPIAPVTINLEGVAGLRFSQKAKWFSSQLHKLWIPWEEGHVQLVFRREHVLEDSLKLLLDMPEEKFRQRWRISFKGEPGLDAGGVMREWITILCGELFDTELGIFAATQGSDTSYWPNMHSSSKNPRHLDYFALAGRLLGKAMLEEYLLPVYLSLPLVKHILAAPISLSDLQFLDQELYSSVLWIKNSDNVEQLSLDFTVRRDLGGEWSDYELIEGGKDIEVTDENKVEYLDALLKYRMLTGVSSQLAKFLDHLYQVVPEDLFKVFDYQELELVISGVPTIDVNDWKTHTTVRYASLIRPSRREKANIDWFWEVLETFTEDQKARLLQFVTGSSRIPPQGFKGLISNDGHVRKFNIVVSGLPAVVGYLPKAHTCFNRLDIPIYKTKDDMIQYLTLIVEMDITGFTIE